jgi:hypothetical protein
MTDDQNHEVGGRVIRAMVIELFSADRTLVHDLEKSAKHFSMPAIRTTAAQTALDRRPKRAV